MRAARLAFTGLIAGASANVAHATTVVIFVEPMTLERYTRVYDTPGPDRVLMCMAPPATSGCTELHFRTTRR